MAYLRLITHLFITATCFASTLADSHDLELSKVFNYCEGYEDRDFDIKELEIRKSRDSGDYYVDYRLFVRDRFGWPLQVTVMLRRPEEKEPYIIYSKENLCYGLIDEPYNRYDDLDVYSGLRRYLAKANNYDCPIDIDTYFPHEDFLISEEGLDELSQLIDKEGTVQQVFGKSCIEFHVKRINGSRPEPKRKALPPPTQEGKTSGIQKIFKFLKGLLSN